MSGVSTHRPLGRRRHQQYGGADPLAASHAWRDLAIDDFGTGYSSLSYLQKFPVDVLKIDRAFVDGVQHGGSDTALAKTIIALGQALGLETVAEGVELESQRKALRSIGCLVGQGYPFSKPREADELTSWLDLDHVRRFSTVTPLVAVAAA